MRTNVRIGNDIKLMWQILDGGVPVNLTNATDIKVSIAQGGIPSCNKIEITTFEVTDAVNGMIAVEVQKEVIAKIGYLWAVLEYTVPDSGMIDGNRKVTTDNLPVKIVGLTDEASQDSEFTVSSDIQAGFQGKSAYEVWLVENPDKTLQDYFDWLQQPATDIEQVVSSNETVRISSEETRQLNETARVEAEALRGSAETQRISDENTRKSNETGRINAETLRLSAEEERGTAEGLRASSETSRNTAEGQRATAETSRATAEGLRAAAETARVNNESKRQSAEELRQTNTAEAIQSANTAAQQADTAAGLANDAAEAANTAAGLADTARLAIQDDLALKADEADLVQLAGEVNLLDAVQGAKIKDIESVISTMNPNQSAQLSVSGVSPLSLPKNAANGGMSVKLEGLTAENLILNGDFRNGMTGVSASYSVNSILNGNLINTGNGNNQEPNIYRVVDLVDTNKYYIKSRTRVTNSNCLFLRQRFFGTTPVDYQINTPVQNKWYDINRVIQAIGSAQRALYIMHSYTDSATANGKVAEVECFFLINLTETFGAGNEPTKEQCDLMFADYFEGRKNFVTTGRIRSVDKNGLNPTALYLTAPELRSNGTVKDEIRKGGNGYELVKRVGVATLSAEKVVNGDFAVSTGWTIAGVGWSISDGKARCNSTAATYIRQNGVVTMGAWQKVKATAVHVRGTSTYITGNTGSTTVLSEGVNSFFVRHIGTSPDIVFLGANYEGTLDDVSIKELVPQDGAISNTSTFTELSDGAILYTLATPQIIPISYGGVLNSAENGTVYHEPVVADAGVYGTNLPILMTDYPIATIEEIIKHENGVDTYLNVASAVVAGDGLSFTHPDLADGDLVLFTYSFSKESTNGNITATFYDSNVVKIDTVTGKAYKITDVVTNGVLTRTLIEV